ERAGAERAGTQRAAASGRRRGRRADRDHRCCGRRRGDHPGDPAPGPAGLGRLAPEGVAAGPTAPRRLSAGVRRLGASTARFPFRVKLHLTPADRMVLRAAVETVLADPDPPPAGLADAPALLSALRPSLGDEPP